jgi:hypothetical protein
MSWISRWIVLAAVLASSAFLCLAQPPVSPPPPPSPPGFAPAPGLDPGVRRPRLRELGGRLLDAVAGPQAGPGTARPLDFSIINGVIPSILKPLISGDAAIESISLEFDPAGTDPAHDKVELHADVRLRSTAWSPTPSRLHIDLSAVVDMTAPGGAKASIDTQLVLETPVVALADYGLQRFKAKAPPLPDTPPASADDFFRTEMRAKLARTDRITSFDELVDLFQYYSSFRFLAQNDNIDRIKAAPIAELDDAMRNALAAELTKARVLRDRLSETRAHVEHGPDGLARTIAVRLVNVELSDAALVEQADVNVTDQSLAVNAHVQVRKGVEVYLLLKPVIQLTLERMQQRDPATIERQRAILNGLLDAVRPFLSSGPTF